MKKIVKIGMALVVVAALFLSMPSLKTLGDFITSKDKEMKTHQQIIDETAPMKRNLTNLSEIATGKNYGTDFIDDVNITDKEGNPISVIKRGEEFKVIYTWSIPDDVDVKQGDYMEILVPKEANINNSVEFYIYKDGDPTKEKMAFADLNHKTNKITMVFTDYPEGKTDVNGLLEFTVKLEVAKSEETIKVPIEFEYGNDGKVIEIEVPGEVDNGNGNGGTSPIVDKELSLGKYGIQGQDKGRIDWAVFVNERLDDLHDAIFTDTLGANQVLDPDSINIWRGTASRADGSLVDSEYVRTEDLDITYRKDGFTINFGDMGKTVYQIYYASYIDPDYEVLNEEDFKNYVKLEANEIGEVNEEAYETYVTGGGSGTGKDTKKINVTEKYIDKATGEKLAKDNLTKFEIPYKETATFKTDTKLIEGYELVEYTTKIGDKEKTTDISDGQTIRMEVEEDTEITYYYEESKFASHIYLRTKDNQLVIHYRNVDQLIVDVDGQQYEIYDVLAQETDENISTPIRVNSDRTVVRVRGKLAGNDAAEASLNSKKTKK